MLEELKILLGDSAANYTDPQLELALKRALAEVEAYTNRSLDYELEAIAVDIALIKLNRMGSEGLASQSFSGINENYIDGYPQHILAVLNRKRRVKLV